MKTIFVFFAFFYIFIVYVKAQDFSSYGKISHEEIQMKECVFDKDATAIILLEEANSNYNSDYNLITNHHIRIKILKEKGIEYADVSIPFYRKNDFEVLYDIKGMAINIDKNGNENRKELEKKLIFKKNTSELYGEVSFAFPDAKVGTIIEYTYLSTMKHYGGLRDWYFQRDLPVVQSKYHLYIIPGYEFAYDVHKTLPLAIKIEPDPQSGSVSFEMKDIPGLEDEPYMDSRKDYMQHIIFQMSGRGNDGFGKQKYMTSWNELTKEWISRSDFGAQLNKDLPGTDDFIKTSKTNPSPFEKMKLVYQYVQSNVTWDGFTSIVSNDGVKTVWGRKKGNSGDLNLILVNLLKAAELEAYPMLVSERSNGKVNTKYPFVGQFNTVYAAVFIDGKKYYLNAIDELTPPHMIPHKILNTTTFIVDKKAGGLTNITNETLQYRDHLTVSASITPEGNIKGEAFLNSSDYARVFRLNSYKSDNEKYIADNFKNANNSIDSFKVTNEEIDSLALKHKFSFICPMNGSGEYKFIPMNLFSGFESNPFTSSKRLSDINFGFKRVITANTYISIPSDFIIDVLPKSIRLINADKTVDFTREIILDAPTQKLLIRIKIDFKKSFYTADEYGDIKEFYKKMFDLLNEQIVIKTK